MAEAQSSSRMKRAFLLSLGRGIATLLGFALMIVMSRALTQGDYGVFQKGITVVQIAGVLLTMGVSSSLFYLLGQSEHSESDLSSGGLGIVLFAGLLFAAAMWLGLAKQLALFFNSPRVEQILLILSVYPLTQLVMQVVTPILLTQKQEKVIVGVTVIGRVIVFTGAIIPLLLGHFSPVWVMSGMVAGALVWLVPLLLVFYRQAKIRPTLPNLSVLKSIMTFGLPLWLSAALVIAFKSIDRFIIGNRESDEVFAVYSNGAFELPFLGILTASITAVLLADLNRLMKADKTGEGFAVWQRAGLKCSLIVLPILGLCMAFAPEMIVFLFGEDYRESAEPFRIYLALLPIRIVSWDVLIIVAGSPRVTLYRSILGLVVNIALSLFLYRRFGVNGVALGTVISIYLIHASVSVPFISRSYKVAVKGLLPWRKLLLVAVATLAATLLAMPCKFLAIPPLLILMAGGLVFLVVYLAAINLFGLQSFSGLVLAGRNITRGLW